MEILLLFIGITILICTFLDFFHTTLSGQGFGWISGKANKLLGRIILKNRNTFIFKYSGFLHLLITALFWLLLLFLGSFLIYASSPEMVVNSDSRVPATMLERLYYTGFVISTLGIGDFIPGKDLSRIFTTILSFSGFILLTTALTYLISVVNTVLQKKQLAIYISTLGNDINEIYGSVITPEGVNLLVKNSNSIREMIIKNSSNYIFFPIVQYYLSDKKEEALELQLVRLYEVLMVLSFQFEPETRQALKIRSILATIVKYVNLRLAKQEDYSFDPEALKAARRFWSRHSLAYPLQPDADQAMNANLRSAGWNWEDVYELKEKKASEFGE